MNLHRAVILFLGFVALTNIVLAQAEHQTLTGTLTDANPEAEYGITAQAGEWLRLAAEIPPGEESFEAVLYTSRGDFVGGYTVSSAHEEWTGVLDPLRIPATDDYRLVLRRVDMFSRGTLGPVTYHLLVEPSQIPLLQAGAPVEASLDDTTTEAAFRYEGTAGEQVEFILEATSDTYAPAWVIEKPYLMRESHTIPDPILFTGMGTSGLRLEYVALLPLTGSYLIRVSNGAATITPYITGSFRLVLNAE
jgi:hypothetical protein